MRSWHFSLSVLVQHDEIAYEVFHQLFLIAQIGHAFRCSVAAARAAATLTLRMARFLDFKPRSWAFSKKMASSSSNAISAMALQCMAGSVADQLNDVIRAVVYTCLLLGHCSATTEKLG